MTKLLRIAKDESGATAIEYGIIAAAIGLMLLIVMPLLSTALQGLFTQVTDGSASF